MDIGALNDKCYKFLLRLNVTCLRSVQFSIKRISVLLYNNLYANLGNTDAIDKCQQPARIY